MSTPALTARAQQLLEQSEDRLYRRTDRMFAGLFVLQWAGAILAALILSPRTWDGDASSVHPHVWLAFGMGAALCLGPSYLVWRLPGRRLTRYVISVAQVLFSSLLIQVTGGRIETHFHVFGSLAFLAFYRDWTVLVPATLVVAVDHFARGTFWPQTVFGITTASPWRWVEHAGWVIFEDVFLAYSCLQIRREMREGVQRTADLERSNELLQLSERDHDQARKAQSAVIETALDAVVCMDQDGRITTWNQRAAETFGWTAAEVLESTLADRIVPAKHRAAHTAGLRRYLATGEGPVLNRRIEVTAIRKGGDEFPVELAVAPMKQGGKTAFCAFIRDITDRQRAAETLRKAKDAAEAANRAKSAFLAHMSHEIRTPLNGILGYADLLTRRGDAIAAEERATHLRTIVDSGRHLLAVINDVLDLSKIEAGQSEVERVLCSPHEIIANVVSLLRVRALEKDLQLEYAWDGGVPEFIVSDPVRLRQLLINLVGNAIKFTQAGTVQITPRLVRGTQRSELEIQVRDTGIGISSDAIQRIFQPFVQADESITRRFGGTGLGLSIAQRMTEALGGRLEVQSESGQGSTFTVSIDAGTLEGVRILSAPRSDINCREDAAAPDAASLAGCRVLVVEDGAANRKLVEILLRDAGADVASAENGQLGIDATLAAIRDQRPFDLILMDMQMPVLDGYSAASQLRAAGIATPIIALTAHAMKGDEEVCRAAGCTGFLTKPINADQLIDKLAAELRTQRADLRQAQARARASALPAERMAAVVRLFREEMTARLAEMQAAAETGHWDVVVRAAHWLKGTGGTVGYDQFTPVAETLEQAARQRDAAAVLASLDRLQGLFQELPADGALAVSENHGAVADRNELDQAESAAHERATVLIVDDEPFNVRLVETLLGFENRYRTLSSTDGAGVPDLVRRERPDIILLDLDLADVSGFDVLAALRGSPELDLLPILIFTASDDWETRRRAMELGATDFISKPFDREAVLARVRSVLDSTRTTYSHS